MVSPLFSVFRARLLYCLAFLLVLGGIAAPAAAAPAASIPLRLCVLRDAPGMTARALLRAPDRFDCTTPQAQFGPGDFWLISQPLSVDGSDKRFAIRTLSVWQEVMTAHILYADGAIFSVRTDAYAASRHVQLGGFVERWLPHRAAPAVRVLWHVEGAQNVRGVMISPSIAGAAAMAHRQVYIGALYAAFAAFAFALLLYNLALWRALKYDFLPYFCLMLAALIAYDFSSSGALGWFFPGLANTTRLRCNYMALGLAGVSALNFVRFFFEPRVFGGRLRMASHITSAMVLTAAAGIMLFGPWHLKAFDTVYTVGFTALVALIVPVLYNAWRQRSDYLGLFALAWGGPIAFGAVRCLYSFGLVRYSFWVDNSTLLAMAVEAMLSSIAIAYRIQQLSRDRDLAREQEMAARMLADIDPLTGLLNRRAFMTSAVGREGEQQLLLLDLDHFKRVNDTIGHDGGDEVLRVVARTLRQAAPEDALVSRFGGEEFIIVVPAGRAIEADMVLARLRAARMPFDLTVTASIGVARGLLTREAEWKTLYRAADVALFDAKAAGRDRARGQLRRVA
jgi:diguanylate cyclase (GGDEF)-like protein